MKRRALKRRYGRHRYGHAVGSKAYFTRADGIGSPGWMYGYAIKIDGIENDFPEFPLGRQMEGHEAVKRFKEVAKSTWLGTKRRKGMRPLAEIKKWIKEVQPSQFYAKWPTNVDDDSVQLWYTGGNFS